MRNYNIIIKGKNDANTTDFQTASNALRHVRKRFKENDGKSCPDLLIIKVQTFAAINEIVSTTISPFDLLFIAKEENEKEAKEFSELSSEWGIGESKKEESR